MSSYWLGGRLARDRRGLQSKKSEMAWYPGSAHTRGPRCQGANLLPQHLPVGSMGGGNNVSSKKRANAAAVSEILVDGTEERARRIFHGIGWCPTQERLLGKVPAQVQLTLIKVPYSE